MNIPNVNHTVNYFVHAYRQAPWRVQRQWIGTFLLVVLGLAMVAALYLDVTAQAAIAGREIQDLASQMIAVQQGDADLQTRLAELTSNSTMEQRAQALGYIPVDAAQIQYLVVPGYAIPASKMLVGAPAFRPSAPSIPPEYTESLLEWFEHSFHTLPAASMIGVSQ